MKPAERRRAAMVERDIAGHGVHDERVLAALRAVPREAFVPAGLRLQACDDRPLPIGCGQTISQPCMVALMAQALQLEGSERVLEVGTGSGYGAAVLARLAACVDSVERIAALAERARQLLARLQVRRVRVHTGDGSLGWPAAAPYDAVCVTACGPVVPPALLAQLAPGGRLVMPVASGEGRQQLLRLTLQAPNRFVTESLCDVAFVPLLGAQAWPER